MPGSIIAVQIFGMAAGSISAAITAFAINMVASAIISKTLGADNALTNDNQNNPNPGNRQQLAPATDNKIPIVYGSAYVGGIVTDLSISSDNQTIYYCISLAEVTNTQTGSGDVFTFGNIYWGGKRCIFDGTDQYKVASLLDESTGQSQTVTDNLFIYLYRNGSYTPTNSSTDAIALMNSAGLVYTWDTSKTMTNCAFAIVKIIYNQDMGLTGIQQTKFQINNPRSAPGDCILDYLQSTRYGGAIPLSQIDTASLTALDAYCSQSFTYTPYGGGSTTQTRFRFDGVVDTQQTVMSNLQQMSASCDCLIRYNEITSTWGVIVQTPTYTTALAINDSNMVSAIQITPTDIASSPNIIETKFANSTDKDAFASAVFSLSQIAPSLLYPNEPVNKQSVSLPLVNNDVRAQYIAQRLLKAGREDLIVKVTISYVGIQLEAGDVVTVTNSNYGWTNKLFRVSQITETFTDDGQLLASLTLMEFNPSVFDDVSIAQFTPAPNTGLPSPLVFGTVPAPTIINLYPNAANPSFGVSVTAAYAGISQYAEVWYSAYSNPTTTQRIFAGTTIVRPSGNPYIPGTNMGTVTLENIPQGDWYFFVRMVNSLGSSQFSSASSLLRWRPTTFQYSNRYLVVAYSTAVDGSTGFSALPTNATYYGLLNSDNTTFSTNPADYTWYLASTSFGTSNFLLYANRSNRKFSFATGPANYFNNTARYVPTQTAIYDISLWSALEGSVNYIDLDARTGQLTQYGGTVTGAGEIAIQNNSSGKIVATLDPLLSNQFGPGVTQLSGSASFITIDVYGRVLGFVSPDGFYYTRFDATATAGQTVFTPTARQANYITGMDLVFRNGVLLDTSEYTENSTTVTLGTGAALNDRITIISMRAINQGVTYSNLNITVQSISTNVVTYNSTTLPFQNIVAGDIHTFINTGTPTQYTVSAYNASTRQITYTATVTSVAAGASIYEYRSNGMSYRPFSRWTTTLSSATSYTPTTWALNSGYEKLFLNGLGVNDQDYDLISNSITNFPSAASGLLTLIQFNQNNQSVAIGNPISVATNTVSGQSTYSFNLDQNAFELYYNGPLQIPTVDYTTATGAYTLIVTPTITGSILQQNTYNRTGAA